MRLIHDDDVTAFTTADGTTYEAGADGTIEVPDEVGAERLQFPGWHQVGDDGEIDQAAAPIAVGELEAIRAELLEAGIDPTDIAGSVKALTPLAAPAKPAAAKKAAK